jgi:hypothetical protein
MSENLGSLYGEVVIKSNVSEQLTIDGKAVDQYGNLLGSMAAKIAAEYNAAEASAKKAAAELEAVTIKMIQDNIKLLSSKNELKEASKQYADALTKVMDARAMATDKDEKSIAILKKLTEANERAKTAYSDAQNLVNINTLKAETNQAKYNAALQKSGEASKNYNILSVQAETLAKTTKLLPEAFDKAHPAIAKTGVVIDEASASASRLALGLSSFGKSAMSVALGMIGAGSIIQAMETVIGMTKRGYEEARELSRAQVQLSAALGYNSVALREQREELDKNLAIEEQDTAIAQLRLANYIKDEQQIRRLIPAVTDLSRAKGIDLASAADIVARSISSDSGELGRFKIVLDGARGSTERIDSAIKGLTANFGGQAQVVKENMNLFERLGKGIGDYFKDLFKTQTEEEKRIFEARKVIAGFESGMLAWKGYDKEYAEAKAYLKKISDEQTAASEAAKKRGEEESRRSDELEKNEIARKKREAERIKYAEELRKTAGDVERQQDEEQAQRSSENHQRQAANVKELYEAKLKLAEEDGKKEAEIESKGTEVRHAIAIAEMQGKIDLYEQLSQSSFLSQSDQTEYAKKASDERINLMQAEADFQKDRLDEQYAVMAGENEKLRPQIDALRDALKKKIEVELGIKIEAEGVKNTDVAKKAQIEIINSWVQNMQLSITSGVHLLTAKTSEEFERAAQEAFQTIAKIGESSKSDFLKNFGLWGQAAGGVIEILDQKYDIFGTNRKRELEKYKEQQKENDDRAFLALRATKELAVDWLASMGYIDLSNQSESQLKTSLKETQQKQKEEVGRVTGIDLSNISSQDFAAVSKEYGADVIEQAAYHQKEGTYGNSYYKKQIQEMMEKYPWMEQVLNQYNSIGVSKENYSKAIDIYNTGDYAQKAKEINSLLANYQVSAGIDHTKSMTWDDFKSDLDTEEGAGKIEPKEHAKLLYEAVQGLPDSTAGLSAGKFLSDVTPQEFTDMTAAYVNWDKNHQDGGSSRRSFDKPVGQAANGGIFNSPTMISEFGQAEAAVPLTNPVRTLEVLNDIYASIPSLGRGGNFQVSVALDPNIPLNRDFAGELASQISERMTRNLNSRGYRN